MKSDKKIGKFILIIIAVVTFGAMDPEVLPAQEPRSSTSTAKPEEATLFPIPDYSGDFWKRARLTGQWGGLRSALANKGIQFEVDTVHIFQHVSDPGIDRTGRYGGSADYTLKVDTHKLGLWPGGFFKLHGESSFGHSVNGQVGSVSPVNGDFLFPGLGRTATALTNVSLVQFLAPWAGVVVGKLETYDADANEFADDHRTKFLNLGFDFNLANALAPVSALGLGIVVIPHKDSIVSLLVLDPNGKPTESGFNNFFNDGVFLAGEGRIRVTPFGLSGHQLLGFTWSNKERISLNQDPTNIARGLIQGKFPRLNDPGPILRRILERFFPGLLIPAQPLNREDTAWSVYYNFDQYLWNPANDPKRGMGVFFRFGVSDGRANPIKYHFNFGIGGKGIFPGRERDTFGIGWSRLEFSDNFVPFLRKNSGVGLRHEDVFELFYNAAVTGWLKVTLNLQVIEPGLKKTLAGDSLKSVNTAVVPGLRVKIDF